MLFQRQKASADSGSTTIRVVLLSVLFNIISYSWKTMTAVGVISDVVSASWDARLFFPLTEGFMILPTAIVISVWMDVANSSLSSRLKLAMTVQLGAIGLGLTACGSGAAKLCHSLRGLGENSANIADTVFRVSRAMGISLYGVFIGETMLLSSRTRKSDPTNLALLGMTVSSLSKCFLNKAIFEYMVESARAKKYRIDVQSRLHAAAPPTLRPAMRLLSSLRSVREGNTNKVFVHEQDEHKATIDSGTAISMIPLTPASKMSPR
ncbi:unnamed protein product [Ectocarpus sp. 12 AP-2014]